MDENPKVDIRAEDYSSKDELANEVISYLEDEDLVGIELEKPYSMGRRSNKRISVKEMVNEEPVKKYYEGIGLSADKTYLVLRK